MEEFYDKLKNKMSSPPKEMIDWEMWEGIKGKIDDTSNRGSIAPLWAWLPIALGLCLFVGYVLGAPKGESSADKDLVRIDTVFINQNVYLKDTIVKTEYITKWSEKNEFLALNDDIVSELTGQNYQTLQAEIERLKNKLEKYQFVIDNSIFKDEQFFSKLMQKYEDQFSAFTDMSNKASISDEIKDIDRFGEIPNIDRLGNRSLFVSNENIIRNWNLNQTKLVRQKKSFLEIIKPDYYNLGLSVNAPTFVFVENLKTGLAFGGSLNLEMLFSQRISLETGVGIVGSFVNIDNEEQAVNYPQPNSSDGDKFKKLGLTLTQLNIPISLKYKPKTNIIWKPYVRVGALVSSIQNEEFKYEYVRGPSEVYFELHGTKTPLSFNSIFGGIGLERKLFYRLVGYVEPFGRYAFNYSSDHPDRSSGLGLNVGFYYEL